MLAVLQNVVNILGKIVFFYICRKYTYTFSCKLTSGEFTILFRRKTYFIIYTVADSFILHYFSLPTLLV